MFTAIIAFLKKIQKQKVQIRAIKPWFHVDGTTKVELEGGERICVLYDQLEPLVGNAQVTPGHFWAILIQPQAVRIEQTGHTDNWGYVEPVYTVSPT